MLISVAITAPESLEQSIAQTHGARVLERQPIRLLNRRLVRLQVASGRTAANLVASLQGDGRLLQVQRNYLYHAQEGVSQSQTAQKPSGAERPAATPGDETSDQHYPLGKLQTQQAWQMATGKRIKIAIIDSGIDARHSELKGVTIQAFDAFGDKGHGGDDHATSVAGLISGRAQVRGLASGAHLIDVRAFKTGKPGGALLATTMVLLRALDWAVAAKADVYNFSFAGPHDSLLAEAITVMGKRKLFMVAAVGNNGSDAPPAYPAAYGGVIAVTAVDAADKLYEKANRGPHVSIAAPGVDLLAPTANESYRIQTGTSFATAYVSGVLALLLERTPTLTADEAKRILQESANDLGQPGLDPLFGAGHVKAYAALKALEQPGKGQARTPPK